ncbi:MAG: glycoside hydrolase family 92 protein, partial [Deltaproteobacteria bacterium]|nr:glycoside hydrolase family 92 protein [Deltaproteobacteria bacterium]
GGEPRDGRVEVVAPDTIRGKAVHQVNPLVALGVGDSAPGTTGISTIYFHARASRPFASHGTWSDGVVTAGSPSAAGTRVGAFGTFATAAGDVVELRVGISFISEDEARAALDAECADRTFEEVRAAAVADWNRLLSRIEVEGGTDAEKTVFYTALYHALMQPADYTEGGRFWIGADGFGKVVEAGAHRWYTDDWCTWDTFRTTHPLLAFLEPEVKDDMVQALVRTYEHSGWMQKCPWNATGDSRVMSGNSEYCVVADAVAKGFDGFATSAAARSRTTWRRGG